MERMSHYAQFLIFKDMHSLDYILLDIGEADFSPSSEREARKRELLNSLFWNV